ncbi:MAG: hypothetical protein IKU76_07880 [Bacteroidaceae bacterium]|nr:hypothetical protein [Bacteroidaceae bacterium]
MDKEAGSKSVFAPASCEQRKTGLPVCRGFLQLFGRQKVGKERQQQNKHKTTVVGLKAGEFSWNTMQDFPTVLLFKGGRQRGGALLATTEPLGLRRSAVWLSGSFGGS